MLSSPPTLRSMSETGVVFGKVLLKFVNFLSGGGQGVEAESSNMNLEEFDDEVQRC